MYKLIHGDCLEVLPTLEAGSVDAVITDPPYNVGFNYNSYDDNKSEEDFLLWATSWFLECRRVAKTVFITGQARLTDYAMIEKWKWLLAWHKPAAMGRSPVGFCNWEPIAMWGKGYNSSVDYIKAPIIPNDDLNGHPCPKPVGWAIGQVNILPPNAVVLDPFMGIGTTGVACMMTGRNFIGIELDKDYFEIAQQRIANAAGDFTLTEREKRSGQMPLWRDER